MSKNVRKAARKQSQTEPVQNPQANPSSVPVPQRAVSASSAPGLTGTSLLWCIIPGLLLFLLMAFQGGGDDRILAVIAAVAFVLSSVGKGPLASIGRRITIPVLAVAVYLALNASSSLYSHFGSFASLEFGKILAAFCVFGIILFRFKDGYGRAMAAVLSSVTAAFALISIDASSLGLLTRVYTGLMDALGCDYSSMNIGYEVGVRVTGIFGNANVLGGILAFGVFLGLYLVHTARNTRDLLGSCILLEINALGFLLAFSMGAIGMFVVSILVYLLAASTGQRLPLLVLMVETALLGLLLAFPAFQGLGAQGALAAVPVLAGPVGGILLWLLHDKSGRRLSAFLNERPRVSAGAVAGLMALMVLYVILAFQITGSYQLSAGETLRRSVYPGGGVYTLEGDWSGNVSVTVESQNSVQTIMQTSTVLYQGDLSSASFTVPEDSKVVYLNFTSLDGAALNTLSLSGGERVKLGYKLLPGFAANRLQGLWANQNAIQRTEFFQDGLRIWQTSPLIGNGLGSVEGLVTSVQQFYYESRYVHNHYIQLLAEMGIPGLLCFLIILLSSAATLLRRRREGEQNPLLAALAACLAMMALHAVTEAVWSISAYQTIALALLALLSITFGRPVARLTGKAAAWLASAVLWLFTLVFAIFLGGNLSAERQYDAVKAGLRPQTPYTMTGLANRDRYNWAQYKTDMAVNACDSEVPEFAATAAEYAGQVRKLGIFSIDYSLASAFYSTLGQWDQFFAVTREGILQVASRSSAWQETFALYESYFPGMDAENAAWYAQQVLMLRDMLLQWNDGRMEPIVLNEQNEAFLQQMQELAG